MPQDITPPGHAKTALRADIQAMRGLAVLLVVFYHASLPGLPSGFLGVDIFFVISGFLITGLIRKGLERGDFSFWSFYYRRAKRLLPAAYTVIALTLVAAPFFLSDMAIGELQTQVWGALTFSINIVHWTQTGYFEAASETKPLLHFWSLAVEEQYYLLMPLMLFWAPRSWWLPLISGTTALSFLMAIWFATTRPDDAFYLLHTRWWQLSLGSIGALYTAKLGSAAWLSLARVPAILALIFIPIFPTGLPHPGTDAAIVCVSTLILILGHDRSTWERTLPVRALALVGNISYSLYLVHWPVMVFTKSAYLADVPNEAIAFSLIVSIVLAYLLHVMIEDPLRRGFDLQAKRLVGGIATASILLALLPSLVARVMASDVDFTELRRHNYGLDRSCAFGPRLPFDGTIPKKCRTTDRPRVLIIGDSYAMAWTSALMAPLKGVGLAQITMSACDPLLGMARFPRQDGGRYSRESARQCIEFFDQVIQTASRETSIQGVVLAGRFQTILSRANLMLVKDGDAYKETETSVELAATGIANMVNALRSAGKSVVILAPPPANGLDIGECIERRSSQRVVLDTPSDCSLPRASVEKYRSLTDDMLASVEATSGAAVIDISSFLCDSNRCITQIGNSPLYRDSGHLSVGGAAVIGMTSDLSRRVTDELGIRY